MSLHIDPRQQCQHISPRGQRCRMLRASEAELFCLHHLRKAASSLLDPEVLAAELFQDTNSFVTADEVNALLGNVVRQLARKRIERKDALAIGYLSQLLLSSLLVMRKEHQAVQEANETRELDQFFAGAQARCLTVAAQARAKQAARAQDPSQSGSVAPASQEAGPSAAPRDYASVRT
ncbi:MAG TPA: hypothetical protein VNH65_00265 [Candidatus Acidoferrum sp.]|nr:hypothetical protein [Candidatus Acidoferrum sp.]